MTQQGKPLRQSDRSETTGKAGAVGKPRGVGWVCGAVADSGIAACPWSVTEPQPLDNQNISASAGVMLKTQWSKLTLHEGWLAEPFAGPLSMERKQNMLIMALWPLPYRRELDAA